MLVVTRFGQPSTDCPYRRDRYAGGIACIRCEDFRGIRVLSRTKDGTLAMWEVSCGREQDDKKRMSNSSDNDCP